MRFAVKDDASRAPPSSNATIRKIKIRRSILMPVCEDIKARLLYAAKFTRREHRMKRTNPAGVVDVAGQQESRCQPGNSVGVFEQQGRRAVYVYPSALPFCRTLSGEPEYECHHLASAKDRSQRCRDLAASVLLADRVFDK